MCSHPVSGAIVGGTSFHAPTGSDVLDHPHRQTSSLNDLQRILADHVIFLGDVDQVLT